MAIALAPELPPAQPQASYNGNGELPPDPAHTPDIPDRLSVTDRYLLGYTDEEKRTWDMKFGPGSYDQKRAEVEEKWAASHERQANELTAVDPGITRDSEPRYVEPGGGQSSNEPLVTTPESEQDRLIEQARKQDWGQGSQDLLYLELQAVLNNLNQGKGLPWVEIEIPSGSDRQHVIDRLHQTLTTLEQNAHLAYVEGEITVFYKDREEASRVIDVLYQLGDLDEKEAAREWETVKHFSEHGTEELPDNSERQGIFSGRRFLNNLRDKTFQATMGAAKFVGAIFNSPSRLNRFINTELPDSWSAEKKRTVKIAGAALITLAAAGTAALLYKTQMDDGGASSELISLRKGLLSDATGGDVDVPSPPTPETMLVDVPIAPGGGTSNIAHDVLHIDFDTADQWKEFNSRTNGMFSGVEGTYFDQTAQEFRILNSGRLQVPQPILDEMLRVADEVKTGR